MSSLIVAALATLTLIGRSNCIGEQACVLDSDGTPCKADHALIGLKRGSCVLQRSTALAKKKAASESCLLQRSTSLAKKTAASEEEDRFLVTLKNTAVSKPKLRKPSALPRGIDVFARQAHETMERTTNQEDLWWPRSKHHGKVQGLALREVEAHTIARQFKDNTSAVEVTTPAPTPASASIDKHANVSMLQGDDIPAVRAEAFFRPVSTTMYCVMWLTIQTLLVHTCLAFSRNADELSGNLKPSSLTLVLATAARNSPFAPVMCILFVANRLRILSATGGLGEPPIFVKICQVISCSGLSGQLLLILLLGFLNRNKEAQALRGVTHSAEQADRDSQRSPCWARVLHWLCLCALHGGLLGVAGSIAYDPECFEASNAVIAASVLCFFFFGVEFSRWVAERATNMVADITDEEAEAVAIGTAEGDSDFQRAKNSAKAKVKSVKGKIRDKAIRVDAEGTVTFLSSALNNASSTVQKAPMIAVLFLAARMRHLQENPPDGTPPYVFSVAFAAAPICLALELIVGFYIGATGKEELGYYRTKVYRSSFLAHFAQHTFAFGVFVSVATVMVSIKYKFGSEEPPALSPTMLGVLTLCTLYFSVQFFLLLGSLARDLFNRKWLTLQNTLLAASISVNFSPLLCVLFVGCRMRALQITDQEGSPPWWEQDCVYLSVCAVVIQFVCCLSLPIFSGAAASVDPDGNVVYDLRPMVGAYAVTVVKYLALLCLYGGIAGICTAVLTMTPETAVSSKPDMHEFIVACISSAITFLLCLMAALILSSAKVVGLAVKLGIESVDRVFLGIDIDVQQAALNVCRGYVNVQGLIAHNPEGHGYTSDYLLKIDRMTVKVNMSRLLSTFGKVFEITELIIEGVELNFEKGSAGNSSNVRAVLDFIDGKGKENEAQAKLKAAAKAAAKASAKAVAKACPKALAKAADAEKKLAEIKAETSGSVQVELKHLRIDNIGAQVVLPRAGPVASVGLGDLDVPDFSSRISHGTSGAAEIVTFVMKTLLKTAGSNFEVVGALVTEGAKHMVHSAVGSAKACGVGMISKGICCGSQSNRASGDAASPKADDSGGERSDNKRRRSP